MNNDNDNRQTPHRSSRPNERGSAFDRVPPWVWWLVLLALLVWNGFAFWPMSKALAPEIARIPYSEFLAQVDANNVARVEIEGQTIRGAFIQPISWSPPPPLLLTGSPSPTSTVQPEPATYSHFQTTYPETVGDPELMALLRAHEVEVEVKPPPSPWLTALFVQGLPLLLLILFFAWMGRQSMVNQGGLFGFGRSRARRYTGEETGVTFDDVAGADEAKQELQEVVDFLRNPQKYHEIGARIPRGVLLVGPPGTGKTLMARAVAGEARAPFFSISASEFVEMFVGVGASRVRDLFQQAKQAAPSIVFIDELDAVGRRRGAGLGAVNDEREQTLNQLLVEMDGFAEREEVIVMAATNRPDVLDPALLRPGRFDRQVTVGLPDYPGRVGILKIHTRRLKLADDVDLETLAAATPGFSGAELANLCNEAALIAARHERKQVTMADFLEAQDKIILGGARRLLLDEHDRKVIAYHEGGHAVVAWFNKEADPVLKVTIIPRGRALGVTEQLPGKDQYNLTRGYLLARLAVMLGGRTAEEIVFDEITTGAENDLVEATKLARRMVTRWGMSELGLIAFQSDEEQPFLGYEMAMGRDYSEAMAARIDQAVQRLLEERHQAARELLEKHREKLDHLAQTLLARTRNRDASRFGRHPRTPTSRLAHHCHPAPGFGHGQQPTVSGQQ
ncbi:MAG: ATP-dependent zinc metalloprotease FtsH [Chloroflexi bacterium]|nr:ATP-dependent zinc metalloprotease FtsH [Chloroflexota bacterium]